MSPDPKSASAPGGNPIICVGEALIDLIANPADSWSEIEQFVPRVGGAPANTAVAIARLGGDSAFLGCLARDQPGDWIQEQLGAFGVDLSRSTVTEHAQTRLAAVTGPADSRDFVFYGSPAADELLTPEHVDDAGLEDASALIASSLLLLTEPGRSAMHRLLERAAQHSIPLTFDPNPRPKSWLDPEQTRRLLLPFIKQAKILKLGASEPTILGMTIEQIRSAQPSDAVLVLTDGANGCWYWYGETDSRLVPSIQVDAIDSTGAGDAFTAALTLRSVEQQGRITFEDIRFASVVGALTTTRHGAMDALPDRASVERMLGERRN